MYGGITSEDLHLDELTVGFDEFHYHNYFTGGNERNGISAGHTAYVPLHLHRTKNLVENDGIDVAFIAMTPPDQAWLLQYRPRWLSPRRHSHGKARYRADQPERAVGEASSETCMFRRSMPSLRSTSP